MKKKRITVAIVAAIFMLTVLSCVVPVLAKYVMEQGKQSVLESENFYFTSNYLGADDTPTYEILGSSVTFELRNSEHGLRINGTDVSYAVTATEGTLSLSAGTLAKGAAALSEITLSYDFQADEQKKEILVTAKGEGVYARTLRAKFIFIKPTEKLKYYIEDVAGRNYAILYICASDVDKSATLFWDMGKLVIDETNDYVFDRITNNLSGTGSATTATIAAGTTAKIIFFKKDLNADFSCEMTVSNDDTIHVS